MDSDRRQASFPGAADEERQASAAERSLPRRTFLARSAALAGAGLLSAAAPGQPQQTPETESVTHPLNGHPNRDVLGRLVLPTESLGPDGVQWALAGFGKWVDGFEPVAELDHGYLSSDEIRYGPPDPRPLWLSQMEALDLEAKSRFSLPFAGLTTIRQETMLRAAVERSLPADHGSSLPRPEYATHVALAMMAWYFRSSEANDLCYSAQIGRHRCRGMRTVSNRPQSISATPDGARSATEGDEAR